MRPALVLILGVVAVGSAALLARWGLQEGLSPVQLAFWRLTIASLLLLAWPPIKAWSGSVTAKQSSLVALSGVFLALHFWTWFVSLESLSVARSTLLVCTSPLWAGLLGLFVRELRPPKSFWLGFLVAFAGLAMLTGIPEVRGNAPQGSLKGDFMAVVGAVAFVPYLLISKAVQPRWGMWRTVTWIYAAAAISLGGMALGSGGILLPPTPGAWMSIVGMAVLAQIGGHTTFNWALRHFSAAQVGTATLLEPVFAGLLAWLLFREALSPLQLAGGFVLLLGVGLAISAGKRDETSQVP